MGTHESRWRPLIQSYFPMFIATLSLLTSIFNGYLNNRFVDLIENTVARVEYMKTCKEIIDAYFLVKARAGGLAGSGAAAGSKDQAAARQSAAEAVARFGALGTYLANLRDDKIRDRYTQLTWGLDKAVAAAPAATPADLAKLLEVPDREFGALNDDCIKSGKAQRL
jgi:hypothetical protein